VEEREAAVERHAEQLRFLEQQLAEQAPEMRKLAEIMGDRQREEREQRDAKVPPHSPPPNTTKHHTASPPHIYICRYNVFLM
jgi:hypothetical protein